MASITMQRIPSTPAVEPLYINEYNTAPIFSGAKAPKKTTPDQNFENTLRATAIKGPHILFIFVSLPKVPANPSAIVGKI